MQMESTAPIDDTNINSQSLHKESIYVIFKICAIKVMTESSMFNSGMFHCKMSNCQKVRQGQHITWDARHCYIC